MRTGGSRKSDGTLIGSLYYSTREVDRPAAVNEASLHDKRYCGAQRSSLK
jgi:hypothetical protein